MIFLLLKDIKLQNEKKLFEFSTNKRITHHSEYDYFY